MAAIQKAVQDLIRPVIRDVPSVAGSSPPPTKQPAGADGKSEPKLAARPPPVAVPIAPARSAGGVATTADAGARRRWAYISGGAGGALFLGGVIAGLQAKSALDAEKKASASGDLGAYDSNKSKAKSMSMVADGLFVAGAAGLGVGTWLFMTSRPPALAFDLAPVPGGAVASISGGF